MRVIVTTDCDRLMEQALVDVGVQPTVISTVDARKGALPLTHSGCTVIKVHGDYRDPRIKNTRLELGHYENRSMICWTACSMSTVSWSADGLRSGTWRFGPLSNGVVTIGLEPIGPIRGNLGRDAHKLVGLRRATVIPITDADSFFRDLAEKVSALEDCARAIHFGGGCGGSDEAILGDAGPAHQPIRSREWGD